MQIVIPPEIIEELKEKALKETLAHFRKESRASLVTAVRKAVIEDVKKTLIADIQKSVAAELKNLDLRKLIQDSIAAAVVPALVKHFESMLDSRYSDY